MKYKILLIIAFINLNIKAQESTVWNDYKKGAPKGKETILPNFSFAGYKYSEVPLPKTDFKVFDVTEYGAIANDSLSDKKAIKKAIAAAVKNRKGIVFFPKGKYHINTDEDDHSPIIIKGSNIIFRGEGDTDEGSTLFFENNLPPKDPKKFWTCPYAIQTTAGGGDDFITEVTSNATRESFEIKVKNASRLKKGDWIILKLLNNDKKLIEYDTKPLAVEPEWKTILNKGVQVNERHQIASVKGNKIRFKEPIHYDVKKKHGWKIHRYAHVETLGFENLLFEGNWKEKFKHHKSAKHDGGWSILKISRAVNSWVKNCTFKNVNNAVSFSQAAYSTALSCDIKGNIGHSAIHADGGSTGILLADINDYAGMHHATGVAGGSTAATVIWRCKYPAHTSFESHASQPRCTLFDNIEGGFFSGRAGGARQNLPNHGRHLVLWNYKATSPGIPDFRFVATDSWYWRIVPPIVVGFHGNTTTFNTKEVQVLESLGQKVKPESLFEEQLKLRLGKLPDWIENIKKQQLN
ncbi:MAG: DUF4955 domain-containing protein [Flavicella sp.]